MLASAIKDAELFLSLCSTPLWIRLVYLVTKKLSARTANVLARRVLWIQIRTIFFHNDICEYRGCCTIFQLWYLFVTRPEWVYDFERWSEQFFSEQFLRANSWLGYVFLVCGHGIASMSYRRRRVLSVRSEFTICVYAIVAKMSKYWICLKFYEAELHICISNNKSPFYLSIRNVLNFLLMRCLKLTEGCPKVWFRLAVLLLRRIPSWHSQLLQTRSRRQPAGPHPCTKC